MGLDLILMTGCETGGAVMGDRAAEATATAVAAIVLIGGGVLLRTAVLNWFVGPMLVVVIVSGLTPVLARRRTR
jgi:hypothetical protein